jgi:hypothetical protein
MTPIDYDILYTYSFHSLPLFKFLDLNRIDKTTTKIFAYYHDIPWKNDVDVLDWFLISEKPAIETFCLKLYDTILELTDISSLFAYTSEYSSILYANYNDNQRLYLPFTKDMQKTLNHLLVHLIMSFQKKLANQQVYVDIYQQVDGFRLILKLALKTMLKEYNRSIEKNSFALVPDRKMSTSPSANYIHIQEKFIPEINNNLQSYKQNYMLYTNAEKLKLLKLLAITYELLIYTLPISIFIEEHRSPMNHYTSPCKHKTINLIKEGVNLPLINVFGVPYYILSQLSYQDIDTNQVHNFDYESFVGYLQVKALYFDQTKKKIEQTNNNERTMNPSASFMIL